jgi:hypothetical protein
VLGLPLAEAERVMAETGVRVVEVTRTAPPGGGPDGPLRVVRERWSAEGVHLVVAATVPMPEGKGGDG